VVTLSMIMTPLLLLAHQKLLATRLHARQKPPEDMMEEQNKPVIIVGFGRFGQIIGRLLYANRIGITVLDHDPDQIDLLRKFGFKVFYGDATRIDLLRAAGAGKRQKHWSLRLTVSRKVLGWLMQSKRNFRICPFSRVLAT
jgi:glutathione-regulated potassium-efflux system ancillary protein KefC